MTTLLKLVFVCIGLGMCLDAFSAQNISKETYKWMDEQGIVQYTERPPKNRAYEKITVNASGGQEVISVSAQEAAEESTDTTESALDELVAANQRNCKIAQQNMEVLKNMARIRVSDEKGENRILTPAEKQGRLDETQKQIDIYCKETNQDN